MSGKLWKQFEADQARRAEENRIWTKFLDVLTGGGLEVPGEMLDEEEGLDVCARCGGQGRHEPWCQDDDMDLDGSVSDGIRRFNRARP